MSPFSGIFHSQITHSRLPGIRTFLLVAEKHPKSLRVTMGFLALEPIFAKASRGAPRVTLRVPEPTLRWWELTTLFQTKCPVSAGSHDIRLRNILFRREAVIGNRGADRGAGCARRGPGS